jgi:hypothetical protein
VTQIPENPAAPAAPAPAALEPLLELAGQLLFLTGELAAAAGHDDAPAVAQAAEELLPLHVEFARIYRTWLARRVTGGLFALGTGDHDRPSAQTRR